MKFDFMVGRFGEEVEIVLYQGPQRHTRLLRSNIFQHSPETVVRSVLRAANDLIGEVYPDHEGDEEDES